MSDDLKGRTPEGRTLEVRETGEHWTDREFVIDGEVAKQTGMPVLYRDGGTRRYFTNRGIVTFPHRLGDGDRTVRLDSSPVEPKGTRG